MLFGNFDGAIERPRSSAAADRQDALQAGFTSPVENLGPIVIEFVSFEMRVGIDVQRCNSEKVRSFGAKRLLMTSSRCCRCPWTAVVLGSCGTGTLACAGASFLRKQAPAGVPVPHEFGSFPFQHAPQVRGSGWARRARDTPQAAVTSTSLPRAHPLDIPPALGCGLHRPRPPPDSPLSPDRRT